MASEVQANVVEVFSSLTIRGDTPDQRWEVQNLPVEVVRNIFIKLNLRDLCSAVLVSRLWRNIGQDPSLWKNFALRVRGTDLVTMRSVIMRPRFLLTGLVRISDIFWNKFSPSQIEDLVKEVLKKKHVKKIYVSLERDVLESPDPKKSRALLGDVPHNVEVADADTKILEIRYRKSFNSLLNKFFTGQYVWGAKLPTRIVSSSTSYSALCSVTLSNTRPVMSYFSPIYSFLNLDSYIYI